MKTLAIVLLTLPAWTCGTRSDTGDLPANLTSATTLEQMYQDAVAFMEEEASGDEVPTTPAIRISWCAGYVVGLNDGLKDLSAYAGMYCAPASATAWQLIEPIVDYAADHPEVQELHRTALALRAWAAAFPCSEGSSVRDSPGIET